MTKCALYYSVIMAFVLLGTTVLSYVIMDTDNSNEALNDGWDNVDGPTKRALQSQFGCCGFKAKNDRPYVKCSLCEYMMYYFFSLPFSLQKRITFSDTIFFS